MLGRCHCHQLPVTTALSKQDKTQQKETEASLDFFTPPAARSREGEGRVERKLNRTSWQGTLPNLGSGGPTAGDECIGFYCAYAVQSGLGPTAPAAAAPLSLSSVDAAAGSDN